MTDQHARPCRPAIDIGALYDALPELDFSRCPWCAELVDECTCESFGWAGKVWWSGHTDA